MLIQFIPNNAIIARIKFHIGKLELWKIAFNNKDFYPPNRLHLIGGWFWRKE